VVDDREESALGPAARDVMARRVGGRRGGDTGGIGANADPFHQQGLGAEPSFPVASCPVGPAADEAGGALVACESWVTLMCVTLRGAGYFVSSLWGTPLAVAQRAVRSKAEIEG
jgi:hypothetical protein